MSTRIRHFTGSAFALATLLIARPSLAAWSHFPTVNSPVCTAADNQQTPTITTDGAGGAFVTWTDSRNGPTDIYVQHLLALGGVDPAWPADGRAVCTASSYQSNPVLVSDGTGGAIVGWEDNRNPSAPDIYAQHVLASGVVDPAWPVDGRAICTAAQGQLAPAIATDGAGGAILTWIDARNGGLTYDIFAQRVLASGSVDPAWPAQGLALCTATSNQISPTIASDGAGGAIVTWQDIRGGLTFDIYAQHARASGTVDPAWPVDGAVVCSAANTQEIPKLVADGAGGAIVTWQDLRGGGTYDIYVQHVFAAGYADFSWPPDGRALCTATASQSNPAIVSDGASGAIVTWQDRRGGSNDDIAAQHVLASGAVDGAWPVDGRTLCSASGDQTFPTIASDGAGGAIVGWQDARSGSFNVDIYAQHALATGAVDASWPADGRGLSTATSLQQVPALVADDAGGAIVVWYDVRAGGFDIYAQRVARYGYLGTPEAEIASVKDVPNDQGGKVKVSWDASWLDTDPSQVVDHYWILRSVPNAVVEAALRGGARVTAEFASASPRLDELFATVFETNTIYWEFVASQQAYHILNGYGVVAATTGDSTGAYNPSTLFMVVAWNSAGTQYWSSSPTGGYSVDNLAPVTPAPFTGNYGGGATHLHWNPNVEADLAHYRLYRGSDPSFVPGPGNLIATPPDTGFADAGAAGSCYKLSAVDAHGNESGFALLTPAGTVSVSEGVVSLALSSPWPNPSAGRVTFALTLPTEGAARLALHDAAGRRVRQFLAGMQTAGEHSVTWDGRDDRGQALAAGRYYLRLEASGRVLARSIVRLE